MAAKYWLGSSPNGEITDEVIIKLCALSEAETGSLDGAAAGTVVASKSVVYDSYGGLLVTGLHDNNIVEGTGTSATVDLTATRTNLVWYANTAQAGAITLPQAVAGNVGMSIKIIVGTTDWSTTAFKLGFANSGSTVMTGYLVLMSAAGSESPDGFVITAGAKSLEIDANDVTAAGGSIGSTYVFTYLEANLVHCEAHGVVTTGTPALDAGAMTSTGTS